MERLEKGAVAAARPVAKTAQEMFKDAVQSLTGSYDQQNQPSQRNQQDQQIKQDEARRLQETRARLVQINREIEEIRKKRDHPPTAPTAQFERAKEKKVVEKQKKESVLAKLIKSRQGSKEAMQRASG